MTDATPSNSRELEADLAAIEQRLKLAQEELDRVTALRREALGRLARHHAERSDDAET